MAENKCQLPCENRQDGMSVCGPGRAAANCRNVAINYRAAELMKMLEPATQSQSQSQSRGCIPNLINLINLR